MSRTMIGKIGMILKGEWNENTYYKKLDVVTLDGSSYVCVKDNESKNVLEQEYWHLIAKRGRDGADGNNGIKGDKGDPFRYEDFTEEQLASLRGEKGEEGIQGIQGVKGDKGEKGDIGAKGDKGDPFRYEDFTEEQLANLKGEKGEQGIQGIQGLKGDTGEKGNDGYTPQKGVDYYTEQEKQEITKEIKTELIENVNSEINKNYDEKTNEFNQNAESYRNDIDSLKQECNELSKNMSFNSIEGETIDIDDAHSYSKNSLKIYGNSKQENREGYQLIDTRNYSNSNNNGVEYIINEDKTIKASGTAGSGNSYFEAMKNTLLTVGKYHFEGCAMSGSNTTYRISMWDKDFKNIGIDTGEGFDFTLDNDTICNCSIVIIENSTVKNLVFKPLLYKGSYDSNKEYEEYGAMPDPKNCSEIECVTSNIDIKKINNLSNFETESNRKNKWN